MTPFVRDALLPAPADDNVWELFHENSKTERHDRPPPIAHIRAQMDRLGTALGYDGYPGTPLPPPQSPGAPIGEVMRARITGRDMVGCRLTLDQVSTLLFHSYGETRDNADTGFPRPFRVVPSGGALYPLDLYVHSARIDGLAAGLYYYDPPAHALRLVRRGDLTNRLCECLVQPELALESGAQIFVTAFFERSTFKYRDSGYRWTLIEAGHVGQNLNLTATALGLAVTCVGGFFDRDVDRLLDLDGITRSTIYMQVVGGRGDGGTGSDW